MSGKALATNEAITDISQLSKLQATVLGLQHTFTMLGATVLVPIITGLDISVTLFMAGLCTLICHLITKKRVPVFLGSSFAFIAPMLAVVEILGQKGMDKAEGLAYARGGIVIAGLVYLVLALLMYYFDADKVLSYFPPVVTGPIIVVIGIKLAPVAINMASQKWSLAAVSFLIVMIVSIFTKGFLKVIPVLVGLIGGYIVALATGNVDFAPMVTKAWVGIPAFSVAKFNMSSILTVAPMAMATMIEHVGNILAIGATVEDDFIKDPGLHRTLLADGVCTSISAMFGGPANTTYSENTGVLALTRVWDSKVMRIAAAFAIVLGLVPKLAGLISTIPTAVVGGISIILFGMIASIGMRTLVEHNVDFTKPRNLIICAIILVLGLGGASIAITPTCSIEGMALAAMVGIVLNRVLPE
ncbi:uracil-xanthine permease family protein [Anaeromicrobium sediminis]|uniref:Uracil permease n=1 Tax=Anaeromicrobium sediminis TaxID=1478221 RepID=A0A267MEP5_9FIRM|nr:solute carrier family 23 protein [Anaeromicrobium sediminis]PAB57398.1 uracil permease [Anaeromicrobium sediminis]